jgi:hypothetical protein
MMEAVLVMIAWLNTDPDCAQKIDAYWAIIDRRYAAMCSQDRGCAAMSEHRHELCRAPRK